MIDLFPNILSALHVDAGSVRRDVAMAALDRAFTRLSAESERAHRLSDIMRMRGGINTPARSFQEIADGFGVTHSNIYAAYKRGLRMFHYGVRQWAIGLELKFGVTQNNPILSDTARKWFGRNRAEEALAYVLDPCKFVKMTEVQPRPSDLGLSTRARNVLLCHITIRGETQLCDEPQLLERLRKKTGNDLLKMHNCGKATAREIIEWAAVRGVDIHTNDPRVLKPQCPNGQKCACSISTRHEWFEAFCREREKTKQTTKTTAYRARAG